MGLESLATDAGNIGNIGTGLDSLTSALFGSSETTSGSTTKDAFSSSSSKMILDEEGIDKIIADILGSEQGLASVFGKENTAGIYDSTVSAQASGDLIANLVGELAKLTAETVQTREDKVTETSETKTESEGLFDKLF